MRRLRTAMPVRLVVLLLLCVLFSSASADEQAEQSARSSANTRPVAAGTGLALQLPQGLPDTNLAMTLSSTDGDIVDAASLVAGTTVLFYASATCPHCMQVAPEVAHLARQLQGRATVVLIGSSSNSLSAIRAFGETYGLPGPWTKDYTGRFSANNQITATPQLFVVQPKVGEAGRFSTLDAYRPLPAGGAFLAELRINLATGKDPNLAWVPGRHVGSRACGYCHQHEFDSWGLTHHSTAYFTLYERQEQNNPKCIGCHVTGLGGPNGHVLGAENSAMVDVGCESCHGAGGPHDGDRTPALAARDQCTKCHDAEHSLSFDLQRALPGIDHFRSVPMDEATFRQARLDLLEGRAEKPLAAFPPGKNLGDAACAGCHADRAASHSKNAHARALKTLAGRGAAKKVECLTCHAVPEAAQPAGSEDFHSGGVGCESCHGPGEKHVAEGGSKGSIVALGEDCPVCVVEAVCTRCHTPEQDPDWSLDNDLKVGGHGGRN